MSSFYIIDVETTGEDPAQDEVIELGVIAYTNNLYDEWAEQLNTLCRANVPITIGAKAVHHIMDGDIPSQAPYAKEAINDMIDEFGFPTYWVAHNAAFEQDFLPYVKGPWICTYKCAMRAWPRLEKFSNQYLRYALNIQFTPEQREVANEVHRAFPDALVTMRILQRLLAEHDASTLAQWSSEVARTPRLMFGKWKGHTWEAVPYDYLYWIAVKSDLDGDTKAQAELELARRRQ